MRSTLGMERKRLRDRARMLALAVVARAHEDEHRRIYHAEVYGSQQARWNRALGVIARRYDDEYRAALADALNELGYESHACSSTSAAATIGQETSGPGAASTARDLPEPDERSEMADRTRSMAGPA